MNELDFEYVRPPLGWHDSIPVFSERTEYVDNYEQISADHLAAYRKDGSNPFMSSELWEEMEASTAALLQKYSAAGDVVLDVGVGMGRLLARFPSLRRYGMDVSTGYLEIARSKGIQVCYSLIEDMPFGRDLFDIVVCTDVLEHVLDLNLCCSRILSVIKPGGVLVVRVPYREELASYADPACQYRFVHLRYFDEHSLRLLFERILGCEVAEVVKAVYALPRRVLQVTRTARLAAVATRVARRFVSPGILLRLQHKLYRPIEINVVVRKPREASSSAPLMSR
jgi:2-polyprenyl-3-methyl-5-hydroxy-6-metoxy-1,4-benzoquinol methylase